MNISSEIHEKKNRPSITTSVAWTSVDRWGSRLIRLAVLAVLARLLDRVDFGLVAAAAVAIDYLSTYVAQGLGLAVIQRENLEPGHLNAMFWVNMTFACLLTGLLWFFAPYAAIWVKAPQAAPVLRWLAIGLILEALSRVHAALLTRQMRFAPLAAVNLISAVSGGIAGISLAFLGWGVWSLVAQHLVGGVSARIALWRFSDWRPKFSFSLSHLRDLYSFSLYIFVDQQMLFLSQRLDEVLMAAYLGVSDLGLYSIAKRLVLLLRELIEMPLAQVLIPAFSRLQKAPGELINMANRTFLLFSLLAFPAFGSLIALAPEAIELLFGASWIDAAWPVRILSIGMLLIGIPLTIYPALLALGRPELLLGLNILAALVGAVLLIPFVRHGVEGIAVAMSLRQLLITGVGMLLMAHVIGKAYKIDLFRSFRGAGIGSILSALIMRLVADGVSYLPVPIVVLTAVLSGAAVYIICVWFFDRSTFHDFLDRVLTFLPKSWRFHFKLPHKE